MTTADLHERYIERHPGSALQFERARRVLPGGETRAVTHFDPFPTSIVRGEGAWLIDVDGARYLDLVNNYTSLVHGNAHPLVTEAAQQALRDGAVFASVHPRQVELAEAISERFAVERVRFTSSGSEAASLAVRIARQATGRRGIVLFEGGYHGSVAPFIPGEPEVHRLPYNDPAALSLVESLDVAAVLVEPFLGAGGVIPGAPDFLHACQDVCRRTGAAFVLDEVQSLRVAPGGAQGLLGLDPDLTVLGKIIGGGLPIGAVAGRAALVDLSSTRDGGPISHGGTFNGHAVAAAAGVVSLRELTVPAIERLNAYAAKLESEIVTAATNKNVTVWTTRFGSILKVHFAPPGAGGNHRWSAAAERELLAALHLHLLEEGVYATPRGMINMSTVMTDAELATAATAYAAVFDRMRPLLESLT